VSEKTAKAARKSLGPKPEDDMVRFKCVFPPCTNMIMVKAPAPGVTSGSPQHLSTLGGIPMCLKHAGMLEFHIWATTSIKFEPQRTASGLVLPGNEKYATTLKQGVPR